MEEEEEEEALTLWLKAKTATAHKEAETSAFIKKLMKGQLVRPAYARFIAMLFLVYSYFSRYILTKREEALSLSL